MLALNVGTRGKEADERLRVKNYTGRDLVGGKNGWHMGPARHAKDWEV